MSYYIACDDVNFMWTLEQVEEFEQLWRSGIVDIIELAEHFDRAAYEMAFLIWDRAHRGYIQAQLESYPREEPEK